MATALTNNVTDIGSPVNYQLMRGLLMAAKKKLPFFNGTVSGSLQKNSGAPAVIWQRVNNLDAVTTALSEPTGNTAWQNGRDLVVPTVSTVAVTPAKYGNAIQLTEEVDLIQMNVRAMQLMDTLGANAGESLNELMMAQYKSATGIRYGGGVASDGAVVTAISSNDIKKAVNVLNRNSAMKFTPIGTGSTNVGTTPIRDAYYGICHPDVEEDIRGLASSGFVSVEQYAGYTPTLPGEFGTLNGVRWCSSELSGLITASAGGGTTTNSLRYTASAGAADIYHSFVYGREAIGSIGLGEEHTKEIYQMYDRVPTVELISHKPGSAGAGDPYNEIATIAWKSWFAGKILNQNWVYWIQTGASRL